MAGLIAFVAEDFQNSHHQLTGAVFFVMTILAQDVEQAVEGGVQLAQAEEVDAVLEGDFDVAERGQLFGGFLNLFHQGPKVFGLTKFAAEGEMLEHGFGAGSFALSQEGLGQSQQGGRLVGEGFQLLVVGFFGGFPLFIKEQAGGFFQQ